MSRSTVSAKDASSFCRKDNGGRDCRPGRRARPVHQPGNRGAGTRCINLVCALGASTRKHSSLLQLSGRETISLGLQLILFACRHPKDEGRQAQHRNRPQESISLGGNEWVPSRELYCDHGHLFDWPHSLYYSYKHVDQIAGLLSWLLQHPACKSSYCVRDAPSARFRPGRSGLRVSFHEPNGRIDRERVHEDCLRACAQRSGRRCSLAIRAAELTWISPTRRYE